MIKRLLNMLHILSLLLVISIQCLAYENTNILPVHNKTQPTVHDNFDTIINIFPIHAELSSLMALLQNKTINESNVSVLLKLVADEETSLNAAEQYLFLIAKAVVLIKLPEIYPIELDEESVVSLLERAKKLSPDISDKQLVQPEFLQLHSILAEYYAKQSQYDLAYIEKTEYLNKYHLYRKDKRLMMISSLEKSFEVADKKANNALLKSQNELRVRRVAEVKDERANQRYNFTIIISTAMLFVLLFFRQLKVRNKLIRLTRTDSLTRIANRSALFEKGQVLVEEFVNQPKELSLLLLDIDHFKRINDNFGHNIGDKVLVVISELVQETMRSRDVFARLGGEEFVALLPYADTHKAKAIAMRINEKIERYDFSSIMLQKHMTISIGVATLISDKMSFDDLLHCADFAMYQAKDLGRNTVICYDQISSSQERRTNTQD